MNIPNDLHASDKGTSKQNKPSVPVSNPIKQVVEVMRKVDLNSPDAVKNEKSIVDSKGKRINLDDEEVRFDYFKGAFVKRKPAKNENQDKK